MVTLRDLKVLVEDLEGMTKEKGKSAQNVKIKFRTFDEQFDENADEFQLPDTITGVDLDVKNWDKVTITIERRSEPTRADEVKQLLEKS